MTEGEWVARGIDPKQAIEFASLGFTPRGAQVLVEARWTPRRAQPWIEAGFEPDEANDGHSWRPIHLDGHGLSPEECFALWQCGVPFLSRDDLPWITKYGVPALIRVARAFEKTSSEFDRGLGQLLRLGLSPDQLIQAANAGYRPGPVAEWSKALGPDASAWGPWSSAGFLPQAAECLSPAFSDPIEAASWIDSGFSPIGAFGYASHGVDLDRAKQLRRDGILPQDLDDPFTPAKWSEAFSRSRGYKHVYSIRSSRLEDRICMAISNIGGMAGGQRGVFTSWTDTAMFLDGGVYYSEGYGFGSLHGAWVFGDKALALVCDRSGLPRPRRLVAPTPVELDREWGEQREMWRESPPEVIRYAWTLELLDVHAARQ